MTLKISIKSSSLLILFDLYPKDAFGCTPQLIIYSLLNLADLSFLFNSFDCSVTPLARRGSYDLEISNSSFARDNAVFKCMMKQAGTGQLLHTSKGRPRPGQIVLRNELAFYN